MTRRALLVWATVLVFLGAFAIALAAWQTNRTGQSLGNRVPLPGRKLPAPQFQLSFGQGLGEHSPLNPLSVLATSEAIYVSDAARGSVLVFSPGGTFIRSIGQPGSAPGQLRYPYGLATDGTHLYVADMGAATILTFGPDGEFQGKFTAPGLLSKPTDLKLHGSELFVADAGLHQVVVFDADGNLIRTIGAPGEGEGELRYPNGVAVGDDGTVYISDSGNNRVQAFGQDGRFLRVVIGPAEDRPFTAPRGIALDAAGTLYVVAGLSNTVVAVDAAGKERFRLDAPAGSAGALSLPTGISIDPEGRLYVAETGSRRITVFH